MASETYLNHHKLNGDHNLQISGYELIKVGNLSNQEKGGVFTSHRYFLPAKVGNVSFSVNP